MNSRISIFKLEFNLGYPELLEKLIAERYLPGALSGFMLKESNSLKISAKHIYKRIKILEQLDPFGHSSKSEIEQYLINDFAISDGYLEIYDSTKSLTPFKESLSNVLSHNFTLEPVTINLRSLIEKITTIFEVSAVQGLEISSFELVTDCLSMVHIKGNENLPDKINLLFENKNYSIRKAIISLDIDEEKIIMEVSEKGSIKLKGSYIDESTLDKLLVLIKGNCH